MMEFSINPLLKLRLENDKTVIYINNRMFLQCKYLLMNPPSEFNEENHKKVKSTNIDAQIKDLDHALEKEEDISIKIAPETEFWAHASNLQAWYENDYNTQVLHSNLAFPLLKKLSKAGDIKAKEVFKQEIIKRFRAGNISVMTYLVKEGYLNQLSIEQSDELYEELDLDTRKKLQKSLQEASKKKERFLF